MEPIGYRIKQVRKHASLTQQRFAEMLGLKQNTIATYEMCKTFPSDRTISDICEKFNVREAWLRTGEGEMLEPLERDAQIMRFVGEALKVEPSVKRRFVTALSKATTEELEAIEQFALKLAEEYRKDQENQENQKGDG